MRILAILCFIRSFNCCVEPMSYTRRKSPFGDVQILKRAQYDLRLNVIESAFYVQDHYLYSFTSRDFSGSVVTEFSDVSVAFFFFVLNTHVTKLPVFLRITISFLNLLKVL